MAISCIGLDISVRLHVSCIHLRSMEPSPISESRRVEVSEIQRSSLEGTMDARVIGGYTDMSTGTYCCIGKSLEAK